MSGDRGGELFRARYAPERRPAAPGRGGASLDGRADQRVHTLQQAQPSPRIVAHRGARRLAAENTLEALRVAFEEGAEGVEFDVQLTADGELVLFHDDDLQALTGAPGRVVDLPWRELRQRVVRDRFGHRGAIPHLQAVFELLAGRVGLINLELKVVGNNGAALTEAVVAALVAAGAPPWLLSSFDREALTRLRSCGLSSPRGLLIDDDPQCHWWGAAQPGAAGSVALAAAARAVGGHLTSVHPHANLLTPERLALWRAGEYATVPWTLNGPRSWRRAVELGVDAVITDDPGGMARWLLAPD